MSENPSEIQANPYNMGPAKDKIRDPRPITIREEVAGLDPELKSRIEALMTTNQVLNRPGELEAYRLILSAQVIDKLYELPDQYREVAENIEKFKNENRQASLFNMIQEELLECDDPNDDVATKLKEARGIILSAAERTGPDGGVLAPMKKLAQNIRDTSTYNEAEKIVKKNLDKVKKANKDSADTTVTHRASHDFDGIAFSYIEAVLSGAYIADVESYFEVSWPDLDIHDSADYQELLEKLDDSEKDDYQEAKHKHPRISWEGAEGHVANLKAIYTAVRNLKEGNANVQNPDILEEIRKILEQISQQSPATAMDGNVEPVEVKLFTEDPVDAYERFLKLAYRCENQYPLQDVEKSNAYYLSLKDRVERSLFLVKIRLQNAKYIKDKIINNLGQAAVALGITSTERGASIPEVTESDIRDLMKSHPIYDFIFHQYGNAAWGNANKVGLNILSAETYQQVDENRTKVRERAVENLVREHGMPAEEARSFALEAEMNVFNECALWGMFEDDSIWKKADKQYPGIKATYIRTKGFSTTTATTKYLHEVPLRNNMDPMSKIIANAIAKPAKETDLCKIDEWARRQIRNSLQNYGKFSDRFLDRIPKQFQEKDFDFDEVVMFSTENKKINNKKRFKEMFWKVEKYQEGGMDKYRLFVPDILPHEQQGSYWSAQARNTDTSKRKSIKDVVLQGGEIDWNQDLASLELWKYEASCIYAVWELYTGGAEKLGGEWIKDINKRLGDIGERDNYAKKRWIYYVMMGLDTQSREPMLANPETEMRRNEANFNEKIIGSSQDVFLPSNGELYFPWDIKKRKKAEELKKRKKRVEKSVVTRTKAKIRSKSRRDY